MSWTKKNYPDSMKNLPEEVRNKAIEIGNALIEDGKMEEGIAIATAISRAKDWAANRGMKIENPEKSHITDVKHHGRDRYVIPFENKWAIKTEGSKKIEKLFHSKKEAIDQARKEAKKENGILTIQKKTGKIEKRISYNPKNIGSEQITRTKNKVNP
ncbi:MAG TPA: DUF2188 domain-containing protein [Bacteroidia bacterium]|jgi:uncharacterized protein YdaT|nr:DUF2188 domain-containing protein [Bacteroidia bacterium]